MGFQYSNSNKIECVYIFQSINPLTHAIFSYFPNLYFGGDTGVHLDSYVNVKNYRLCSAGISYELLEVDLHPRNSAYSF